MGDLRTATGRPLDAGALGSAGAEAAVPSWVEVNLGAVAHNAGAIAGLVAPARVCAVVKKNAYGTGAVAVAKRLAAMPEPTRPAMLAVYDLADAAALIEVGVELPLLVFHPVRDLRRTDAVYRFASRGKLHLALHDPAQLESLWACARRIGLRLPVHLYVDTGMSRAGFSEALGVEAYRRLMRPGARVGGGGGGSGGGGGGGGLELAGVYTHMSSSPDQPDRTAAQAEAFDRFLAAAAGVAPLPESAWVHVANTHTLYRAATYHRSLVRVGLGLHGFGDAELEGGPELDVPAEHRLRPSVRWLAPLVHACVRPTGTPVGYGATRHTDRVSVLGVVPVGYGDGYPLSLSDRAAVRLWREGGPGEPAELLGEAAVLGRVNMDQLTIDLTDVVARRDPGGLRDRIAAAGEDADRLGAIDASGLLAGEAGPGDMAGGVAGGGSRGSGLTVELYGDDPAGVNAMSKLAALSGRHCYDLLCALHPRVPRRYR